MTQRTPHGYAHIHAYRTWLDEHDELLLKSAVGPSCTALTQPMSVESIAVCLGRSISAVQARASKLGVELATREYLQALKDEQQRLADEFVERNI